MKKIKHVHWIKPQGGHWLSLKEQFKWQSGVETTSGEWNSELEVRQGKQHGQIYSKQLQEMREIDKMRITQRLCG